MAGRQQRVAAAVVLHQKRRAPARLPAHAEQCRHRHVALLASVREREPVLPVAIRVGPLMPAARPLPFGLPAARDSSRVLGGGWRYHRARELQRAAAAATAAAQEHRPAGNGADLRICRSEHVAALGRRPGCCTEVGPRRAHGSSVGTPPKRQGAAEHSVGMRRVRALLQPQAVALRLRLGSASASASASGHAPHHHASRCVLDSAKQARRADCGVRRRLKLARAVRDDQLRSHSEAAIATQQLPDGEGQRAVVDRRHAPCGGPLLHRGELARKHERTLAPRSCRRRAHERRAFYQRREPLPIARQASLARGSGRNAAEITLVRAVV
eukprot:scaffold21555_cov66-Phaeocystis_antarctica.AAC.3